MRIAVVGIGHVGLVSAAAFASLGHDVVGFDIDGSKVRDLTDARVPFHENGLTELVRSGLSAGRLSFTTDPAVAVEGAQVVLVCVGRPPVGLGDRSLTAVEDTVRSVARCAADGVVVVLKSTVPPGTCARAAEVLARERPGLAFTVASSPEFLREGHAVEDTLEPERIVVGADEQWALMVLRELYQPIVRRGVELIETDPRTAELAKLSSNAFLATKISFANALARIADRAGADIVDVTRIMGADTRIGPDFLNAGLGYGGYCLPKDVATLERVASRLGYDFAMLREVNRINDEALDAIWRLIEEAIWTLDRKVITLLGLAFKPGTDDVRSAPALALARRLLDEGATVVGHDPMAGVPAARDLPAMRVAPDPYEAVDGAACVVLCTEWDEYRELDLPRMKSVMSVPVLVDARAWIDPGAAEDAGFIVRSVRARAGMVD